MQNNTSILPPPGRMNSNQSLSVYPKWFNTYSLVVGFCVFSLCFGGIIANGVSVAVFLSANFRHISINILLMALSLADLCFLLLSLPVFMPHNVVAFLGGADNAYKVHVITATYLYPVSIMFHCASIWLLMIITFERWLAVSRPFAVAYYCTRARAYIAIGVTIFLAISFNVVRLWEYKIEMSDSGEVNVRILLANNDQYKMWYVKIGSQITIYIIPLLVLITFNSLISFSLNKAITKRSQMSKDQKSDRRTAKMMSAVVIVFIGCYSLSLLLHLVENFVSNLFQSTLGYALVDLNNLLVICNAATTFIFYIKFSSRYRWALKLVLMRVFCPSRHSARFRSHRTLSYATSEGLLFMPHTAFQALSGVSNAYKAHVITATYLYPVSIMFHCASIWLLMIITFERWLAVSRPFAVGHYCTRTRAYIAIGMTTFLAISFNLVRFWEYKIEMTNSGQIKAELLLANNSKYKLWYVTIGSQITIYVVPLLVLITFNSLISFALKKAIKKRSEMSKDQKADQRTTKMMSAVVIVFVCCYSLSLLLQLVETFVPNIFNSILGYALVDLNNLLVICNAATTFIFYIIFSSRYRSTLKLILLRVFCPSRYRVIATRSRMYEGSRFASRSSSIASQRASNKYHTSYSPALGRSEYSNLLQPSLALNENQQHSSNTETGTEEKDRDRTKGLFRERCITANSNISITVSVHCEVTNV